MDCGGDFSYLTRQVTKNQFLYTSVAICRSVSHLEADVVGHAVLPFCDLPHLLLDVLLGGVLHVYVETISASVVAGDGLWTHTLNKSIAYF